MKKILAFFSIILFIFTLSSCKLFNNKDENVVDIGDGKNFVKWTLIDNDNPYRPVDSAYFLFNEDSFKYYENGQLKKEGTHRISYYGVENLISPLHLNLNFGVDENGFSVYDYIDCYTEDDKDNIHQFTMKSLGYHIEPVRSGGVPVRDYHLSEMPYAFGTYLKESTNSYTYQNGKVNYLECAKLNGKFVDNFGNVMFFVNNSFSNNYKTNEYSSYSVYMRYENNINNTFIEGTIKLSYLENSVNGTRKGLAHVYVMHGDNEPGVDKGTYAWADYELLDFVFNSDGSISFSSGTYYYDNRECNYDPMNFIGGTYYNIN